MYQTYSNMPCGCGKKRTGTVHFMGQEGAQTADPVEWGPIVWKYLHCLAEKIGMSGNSIVDGDQANYMESIINSFHLVLPCTECQEHAAQYISSNPLPSLKALKGEQLRSTVRNWLFTFHNNVRTRKQQPILISNVQECASNYASCFVPKCEYTLFVQSVAFAVRQGWVRVDNWKKWYSNSERLRILIGNIIV
jgi:hypothetical protein